MADPTIEMPYNVCPISQNGAGHAPMIGPPIFGSFIEPHKHIGRERVQHEIAKKNALRKVASLKNLGQYLASDLFDLRETQHHQMIKIQTQTSQRFHETSNEQSPTGTILRNCPTNIVIQEITTATVAATLLQKQQR